MVGWTPWYLQLMGRSAYSQFGRLILSENICSRPFLSLLFYHKAFLLNSKFSTSTRDTTAKMLNASGDKIVRNITMGTTVTAAYFLLRADYGPESNALDPIKNAIVLAENHVKELVLGQSGKPQGNRVGSPSTTNSKEQHP